MAIQINPDEHGLSCCVCGTFYPKKKGVFPSSYAPMYKGLEYIPICRECLDNMFKKLLAQTDNDERIAMHALCRKLNVYWNDSLFSNIYLKTGNDKLVSRYLARLAMNSTFYGKSYETTLAEADVLWTFEDEYKEMLEQYHSVVAAENADEESEAGYDYDDAPPTKFEVTEDMVDYWGSGMDRVTYYRLEKKRKNLMSKLPEGVDLDLGAELLIKQICPLELDIQRDRLAGKPVDKSVNILNTLIGSMNLKPTQKKDNTDGELEKTPLGVWLWKYEYDEPLPEVDPELRDVDGLRKYITIWFFGHLCKMLGLKNSYSRLYEEEIEKLKVERPEFDDDDDDNFLYNIFGEEEQEPDGE